jgi:hypothetical protein
MAPEGSYTSPLFDLTVWYRSIRRGDNLAAGVSERDLYR